MTNRGVVNGYVVNKYRMEQRFILATILCAAVVSHGLVYFLGRSHGYDSGYKVAVHQIREGLKEMANGKSAFRLNGVDGIKFHPRKGEPMDINYAGAGDDTWR